MTLNYFSSSYIEALSCVKSPTLHAHLSLSIKGFILRLKMNILSFIFEHLVSSEFHQSNMWLTD